MEDSKFVDCRFALSPLACRLSCTVLSGVNPAHFLFSLFPLFNFSGGRGGGNRAGNGYNKGGSAGPYKTVGRGGPRGGDYPQEGDRDAFGNNYAMNDKLLMRDRAASIGSQGGGEGGAGRERSGSTTRGAADSAANTPAAAAPVKATPPAP